MKRAYGSHCDAPDPKRRKKNSKPCVFKDCFRSACYNYAHSTKPLYCKVHAFPNMINVKTSQTKQTTTCLEAQCLKRACCGYLYDRKPLYCSLHRRENMANFNSKICAHESCTECGLYYVENNTSTRFCHRHKPEQAKVFVRPSQKCIHEHCSKRSQYNYPEEKKPLVCRRHRVVGMVHVASSFYQTCLSVHCTRRAIFGEPNSNSKQYCKTHAPHHYVNLNSTQCQYETCRKSACFTSQANSSLRFCSQHKRDGMIRLWHNSCQYEQCTITASYNFPHEKKAKYCSKHKESGMIHVRIRHCTHNGCKTKASFGIPGQVSIFCSVHKTEGMIYRPRRTCEECERPALYGINRVPTHCEEHQDNNHINLVQHRCTSCALLDIVDEDGCCSYCSSYLKTRAHLRKQKQVKRWLDQHHALNNYQSYDSPVEQGQCGKERPDFIYEANTHKVLLEVDEHQHNSYPCECEQTRMINLTTALGMPCYWIRYNPDEFKGSHVTEQFRRDTLEKALTLAMRTPPSNKQEFCRVLHLFFDGFQRGKPLTPSTLPII